MEEGHFSFKCLILVILFILTLSFTNYVRASDPEIYSIIPNSGSNKVSTQITIEGINFQPSSLASLYEGGPYLAGSCVTPDDAKGVYVKENYAYVAADNSGLQIIDISDPDDPFTIGSCDTPGYARGVYVKENYAYVAADNSGLQIIDISDPNDPTFIDSCDTPERAWGVYVKENYAYVAADFSGLQIIDISNPANPFTIGSCDTPKRAYGVYVKENYAYVAADDSGLQIIDISDPNDPFIIGSYDTPDDAWGVYVKENYAYVAADNSGLQIIDINNPDTPTFIGSCDTPERAFGVYVKENCAYVADGYSGLQIIDISDPAAPTIIDSCDTPGYARGVYVKENYTYVADWSSGLQVIKQFKLLEDINYIDSGTITATVPAGMLCGAYNLRIINPDGGHTVFPNAFTIYFSQSPELTFIGNKIIDENQLLNFTISATDPDGDVLTYSVNNLPLGADFDPISQKFNWEPNYNQAGSYEVTFMVTDNGTPPLTDSETITITVINKAPPSSNGGGGSGSGGGGGWYSGLYTQGYEYWNGANYQHQLWNNQLLSNYRQPMYQQAGQFWPILSQTWQQQNWVKPFDLQSYTPSTSYMQPWFQQQYQKWDYTGYQQLALSDLWNWPMKHSDFTGYLQ